MPWAAADWINRNCAGVTAVVTTEVLLSVMFERVCVEVWGIPKADDEAISAIFDPVSVETFDIISEARFV